MATSVLGRRSRHALVPTRIFAIEPLARRVELRSSMRALMWPFWIAATRYALTTTSFTGTNSAALIRGNRLSSTTPDSPTTVGDGIALVSFSTSVAAIGAP